MEDGYLCDVTCFLLPTLETEVEANRKPIVTSVPKQHSFRWEISSVHGAH